MYSNPGMETYQSVLNMTHPQGVSFTYRLFHIPCPIGTEDGADVRAMIIGHSVYNLFLRNYFFCNYTGFPQKDARFSKIIEYTDF